MCENLLAGSHYAAACMQYSSVAWCGWKELRSRVTHIYTVRPSVASLFSAASRDSNGPWDKTYNTRAFVHCSDHYLVL
jgi:hypothetical protein